MLSTGPAVAPTLAARTPSSLLVSPAALAANTALVRDLCGTPVMAVVKADGFGLGAEIVARAVLAGGATELGVATCDEALALRAAGIAVPILVWMLHPGAPLAEAIAADVTLSCASLAMLESIIAATEHVGVPARIELEVETGMHRSGCPPHEWLQLCGAADAAARRGAVEVTGVWTHSGVTDPRPEAFDEPLERLDRAWREAQDAGLARLRRHAASSLAAVAVPAARLDVVRVGAALFGIEPVASRPVGLRPVVRWETVVTQMRDIGPATRWDTASSIAALAGAVSRFFPWDTPTVFPEPRGRASRCGSTDGGIRWSEPSRWISASSTSATRRSGSARASSCSGIRHRGSRPCGSGRSSWGPFRRRC